MIPWTEGQAQIQIEQPLKHTEQLRFTSQNKRVDYPIYSGHWEKDIFVYQLPWDFFVLPIALCVCVCVAGEGRWPLIPCRFPFAISITYPYLILNVKFSGIFL